MIKVPGDPEQQTAPPLETPKWPPVMECLVIPISYPWREPSPLVVPMCHEMPSPVLSGSGNCPRSIAPSGARTHLWIVRGLIKIAVSSRSKRNKLGGGDQQEVCGGSRVIQHGLDWPEHACSGQRSVLKTTLVWWSDVSPDRAQTSGIHKPPGVPC